MMSPATFSPTPGISRNSSAVAVLMLILMMSQIQVQGIYSNIFQCEFLQKISHRKNTRN